VPKLALSPGKTFNQFLYYDKRLDFEKRDIVLVLATGFFIAGLLPFMAPIYAVAIGIGIFFVIKVFVVKRKNLMKKHIGEGICATCGEQIINKKCPNCDASPKDS